MCNWALGPSDWALAYTPYWTSATASSDWTSTDASRRASADASPNGTSADASPDGTSAHAHTWTFADASARASADTSHRNSLRCVAQAFTGTPRRAPANGPLRYCTWTLALTPGTYAHTLAHRFLWTPGMAPRFDMFVTSCGQKICTSIRFCFCDAIAAQLPILFRDFS